MTLIPRWILTFLILFDNKAIFCQQSLQEISSTTLIDSRQKVSAKVHTEKKQVKAGEIFSVAVTLDHQKSWHTHTNRPLIPPKFGDTSNVIKTNIFISSNSEQFFTPLYSHIDWPEKKIISMNLGKGAFDYPVFSDKATIYLPIEVHNSTPVGSYQLTIKPTYQACNDKICLMPTPQKEGDINRWLDYGYNLNIEVVEEATIVKNELPVIFQNKIFRQGTWTSPSNFEENNEAIKKQVKNKVKVAEQSTWLERLTWLLITLLILSGVVWILIGIFKNKNKDKNKSSFLLAIFTLVICLLTLVYLTLHHKFQTNLNSGKESLSWISYSKSRWKELSNQSRFRLVNFTAEWCLNCKVLEKTVLQSKDIIEILRKKDVLAIEVDLTSAENEEGENFFTKMGGIGLPYLLIFNQKNEIIFSNNDFYTKSQIIKSFEETETVKVNQNQNNDIVKFSPLGQNFSINSKDSFGFILMLILSFLAGVILNFTPCVLPVLPLKLLALKKYAQTPSKLALLCSSTALGIISFWLFLAFLLSTVVETKHVGFLFSYPIFTLFVGIIVFLMGISMFISSKQYLPQWIYKINPEPNNIQGSFAFGLMTTILATPCTGPFMGTALTWSLTTTSFNTFSVFFMIGLGMSFPYFVFFLKPKLLQQLSKSSNITPYIKESLGLFILAVAIWFLGISLEQFLA
mgnify:CR=1 FL=1